MSAEWVRFLRPWGDLGWGWIIFRTVYTQESDLLWPQVLEKLKLAAFKDYDNENEDVREEVRNQAKELYSVTVMEDEDLFNNAPINTHRKHFLNWLDNNSPTGCGTLVGENTKLKCFMVIDEECHTSVVSSPDPLPDALDTDAEEEEKWFIRLAAGDFDPESDETSDWPGWMNVSIVSLWYFWLRLQSEEMDL
jgi:hypothetical protein